VECGACHKPLSPPVASSVARRQYRFPSTACATCHQDPHRTKTSCETCHSSQSWRESRPFDHSTTAFPLESAHQRVACAGCHKAQPKAAPLFSKTPARCSDCHEDYHAGQFWNGSPREDCSACHNVTRWNALMFDHDRARFPLDRAHVNVRCALCHPRRIAGNGKEITKFRGVPVECTKCH
jgi:hypothetical protein